MAVNSVSVQPPSQAGGTWVVKLGSAALSREGGGLDEAMLARWVERICRLRDVHGASLVLVSSGAVTEGLARLQWSQRPREVHRLQAAASVGQPGLMQAYERLFRLRGVLSAQILLTHGDLADRDRHRNVRATLRTLLNLKVVPVVNQNDAVSTEEIGGGDNDGLAVLVARMVGAERLVLAGEQQTSMSSAAGAPSARKAMREPLRAERLPALWGGTTSVVAAQEPDCLLRLAQEPSPVGAALTCATRAEALVVQI